MKSFTTNYGLGMWTDHENPGASELNNNWTLIDNILNYMIDSRGTNVGKSEQALTGSLRLLNSVFIDTINENTTDAGVTIEGILHKDGRITGLLSPSANDEPATKEYVDQFVQGLDWQESVISKGLTTPPTNPEIGDRYLIITGDTGTPWEGHDNQIAEWNGTVWEFTVPDKGTTVDVEDEDKYYTYNGTEWILMAGMFNHNQLAGLQGGQTGEYYHLTAQQLGNLSHNIEGINVETLTGDKTLVAGTDKMYQYLNPNGANRIITLDTASANAGDRFVIRNNGPYDIPYYLRIKQGVSDLDYIYAGAIKEFIFDGTNWVSGENGTGENDDKKYNISVGYNANSRDSGVAVGYGSNGNDYGVAVGYNAYGNSNGVAVGYNAYGNSYGVAVGNSAKGFFNGIAIGSQAGYNLGTQNPNKNILIGYKAGYNFTTANNNIIIGYDIEGLADDQNKLNIGNLIKGDLLNGRVGIGTEPNSAYNLDVNGDGHFSGNLAIDGNVGFFGTTPTVKTSVTDPSAIVTTETAGTTYTTNEQNMLEHLKTDITNLHSKLAEIINALQSYGLI